MRFVLFVEGHTERKAVPGFLKRWLNARLSKPVGIKTVRFDGWPGLLKDVATKARLHLESSEVIRVVSLLDLYGPNLYPPDCQTPAARETWATQYIEAKVGNPRFLQRFAVHETEAWLLSQPSMFPREVQEVLPQKVQTPERVNFDEPPSYLLERLYGVAKRGSYKKLVYGTQLFARLDPDVAYQKCPRLSALLDELLALAKIAGL